MPVSRRGRTRPIATGGSTGAVALAVLRMTATKGCGVVGALGLEPRTR